MNEDRIKIKSEINKSTFIVVLIGGMVFMTIGGVIVYNNFENYVGIIAGVILSVFGTYFVFMSLKTDVLEISKTTLIIKSIFGPVKRRIKLNDFLSYNEIEKENKHLKWKDLMLFQREGKAYKIHSSNYNNYDEIKRYLISGIKRNVESEKEWKRKNSIYFGVFSTLFGVLAFGFLFANQSSNELEDNIIAFLFFGLFIAYGLYLIAKNKKQ